MTIMKKLPYKVLAQILEDDVDIKEYSIRCYFTNHIIDYRAENLKRDLEVYRLGFEKKCSPYNENFDIDEKIKLYGEEFIIGHTEWFGFNHDDHVKLNKLADWFDIEQSRGLYDWKGTEVQDDLRRMADYFERELDKCWR